VRRSKKKHILIAIPSRNTLVHIPVATFACEAIKQNARRGCPYRFSVALLEGVEPTEYARNILVTASLDRKDVDAIWFVDEDMKPTWPDSFKMLDIDSDIVAGVAPILSKEITKPSFTWNLYKEVQKGKDDKETSFFPIGLNGGKPMEVDGVGTACMIIKRHVLEDKRLWLAPERVDGIVPLFRWPRAITGATLGTDDLDFCRRARTLGYKITAAPNIRWGHMKEIDLMWIMQKIQSLTVKPPEALLTLNDYNDFNVQRGHPPTFVYQKDPSLPLKPSNEATLNPGECALIVPTVAN
jgi:hypothetical protein